MKALKNLGMVLLTIFLSVSFAACSSDDDDITSSSPLAGTTWKITSASDEDAVGATITFKADGNATYSADPDWTYMKWTETDGQLKIF